MLNKNNLIFSITDFKFSYPFTDSQIKLNGQFDIYQNDIILISGASGIGKSTLLYALKGLIPHVIHGTLEGDILYHNKHIMELSSVQLSQIGLLLQNPDAQIITNSVIEELGFGLENLQQSRDEILNTINTYADKFNIRHLLNKSTTELSTGEKQQINLISILMTQPDVLLLDEPTAFLDPESAQYFINTLNSLTNTTIIIIEHNLGYLKDKITRCLHIKADGSIVEKNIKQIQWVQELSTPLNKNQILSTNKECILRVKNYPLKNKRYNINNFMVCGGDIIGIMGSNGVGKSTFLQTLAGLNKVHDCVYLFDQDIHKIKNYFELIGLLWQNPENHFVYNTVAKELENTNIQSFDFAKHMLQNPFTLSEGQKRRLSFSILHSLDRKIYLLDEPSFGQDLENKQLLIQMIYDMALSGKGLIIVSHDYQFLKAICTKIFIFTQMGLITHEE